MAVYVVRPGRVPRGTPCPLPAAALLKRVHPTGLLSGPERACVDTLQPLADAVGVELQRSPRLGPGSTEWFLLGLMTGAQHGLVVCPDAAVMGRALAWVRRHGEVQDDGDDDGWLRPGTIWKATPRSHGSCRLERYTASSVRLGDGYRLPLRQVRNASR